MAKKNKSIESELEDIIGAYAQSLMGVYAALHLSLVAVARSANSDVISNCFNKLVAVVLHEVGLLDVSNEDLYRYEEKDVCMTLIDEKVRIAKTVTTLFLTKLLEDKTVEEFVEQIESVGEGLRQRLLSMEDKTVN